MRSILSIFFVIMSATFFPIFCSATSVQVTEANQSRDCKDKEDKEHIKAGVVKQLGNLPAFFIENQGQTSEDVRYYFKGNDTVYFTDEGLIFQKVEYGGHGEEEGPGARHVSFEESAGGTTPITHRAISYELTFPGANPVTPRAGKELEGSVNYFIGSDSSRWHNNIPTYREIVYPALYGEPEAESGKLLNTIDLVYKGVKGGIKYEFIVSPGADPDVIKMSYKGIEGLSIDESGNLVIHTALGEVIDERPYCYQDIGGKRVEVTTSFKILSPEPAATPGGRLAGPLTPSAVHSLEATRAAHKARGSSTVLRLQITTQTTPLL